MVAFMQIVEAILVFSSIGFGYMAMDMQRNHKRNARMHWQRNSYPWQIGWLVVGSLTCAVCYGIVVASK